MYGSNESDLYDFLANLDEETTEELVKGYNNPSAVAYHRGR